jgi:hypothetical protein
MPRCRRACVEADKYQFQVTDAVDALSDSPLLESAGHQLLAGDYVSAEGAPGKAWVGRMPCKDVTETLRRNPAGQARPAKAGDQPEPSVAWNGGNPGREAYTGSVWAV